MFRAQEVCRAAKGYAASSDTPKEGVGEVGGCLWQAEENSRSGRRMLLSSLTGFKEEQPESWLLPLPSVGFSPFLPSNPQSKQRHK